MIPCVYCDGGSKSPSSDGRTECGFCDDGLMVRPDWWREPRSKRDALLAKEGAG